MKNSMKNTVETGQKYVNILGINVISTSMERLLAALRDRVSHNHTFSIVTVNSELVLASTKNPNLKSALNSADFSVLDGVGLNYASRFLYGIGINRIPGRILFEKLIELANKKEWKVFFLGGEGNEAETAADRLRINYKKVKIETFAGPLVNNNAEPKSAADMELQEEAVKRINKFAPHLLFVAMKNPKQEIWVQKNLKNLNVVGAMVVGGTFRYVAGISKLPPRWMAAIGLEWLWRLVMEPYRAGRVINAVIIFPLRVFWFKVTGK
jgi:N-acetylglucosaminyldiphosphoundecaprenol N-acetyl-beta-D-mannosaminyltransferase